MNEFIKEMEKYAEEENVPIIEKASINFINKLIEIQNVETVLEIGTAIGYSAIMMALANDKVKITTIEKDEKRYIEALKNIKKCGLEDRINVVFQDALEVNMAGLNYDLIFIDAAKGQYIKYFDKFQYYLNEDGTIITDNIGFHGLVGNKEAAGSKNLEKLVEKIENYIEFLKNNPDFITKFYEVGDGLSVSIRREK